jgi:hypothetical protein
VPEIWIAFVLVEELNNYIIELFAISYNAVTIKLGQHLVFFIYYVSSLLDIF